MANNDLLSKVESLIDYEAMIEELKAEAETIRDEIKKEMDSRELEELSIGSHVVRFTSIVSTRFDTKAFKEKMGAELYKAFTREVTSKRFTIA